MKINENYIEISPTEIISILKLAIQGALTTDAIQEDKQKTISFINDICIKCDIKYGELYEIRIIGDE